MTAPATLICRGETPSDLAAIRSVEAAAFRRPNEAKLVDALRRGGGLTLSKVAELQGKVIAHIAYSPVNIEGSSESFSALALAPMAVHPDKQRQGIGSALLRWSLDECRHAGHELVIVLGHPEYYPRFGFVPAMPLGVRCPFEVPSDAFLLLELRPGALDDHRGAVRYRAEFAAV